MSNSRLLLAACAILMVLVPAGTVHANVMYTVSMDTSAISGAGYALAFQLTDGSSVGDANNTVTLSNFGFGGGVAIPGSTQTGGATGDIGSAVVLTDSDALLNSHAQAFTPGASLSFTLDLTTNVDAGSTPDLFGFSILLNGAAVPTLDDLFADTFLYINIDSADPAVYRWASVDGSLDAPTVTAASAVPEPGSLLLMGTGLVGLVAIVRRRVTR